jgi:hypothetical protein
VATLRLLFTINLPWKHGVLIQTLKIYADILTQYPLRREAKLVTSDGRQRLRNTIVMLFPPSITISGIKYIGKETNMLDEREAGLSSFEDDSLILEPDEWESRSLPLINQFPTNEIAEKTGMSRRQIIRLKQGKCYPHPETLMRLKTALITH